MTERLQYAGGSSRQFWHVGAAFVFGGGIWSMHFIVMLAYRPPLPMTYHPLITILSGLVAVLVVWFGLRIFERQVTLVALAREDSLLVMNDPGAMFD
jgi:NO-binding membrane sensor protein with MHYT domain